MTGSNLNAGLEPGDGMHAPVSRRSGCRDVFGVPVDAISGSELFSRVLSWAGSVQGHYVCLAAVGSVAGIRQSSRYRSALESADLVLPDGMPLVWVLRLGGVPAQERLCGPDLIYALCELAAREGVTVGFYGSTEATLAKIRANFSARFPHLHIGFMISPSFRGLSESEEAAHVATINSTGARFVFVGLGYPKQELWMRRHRQDINATMFGLGASFDVAAGNQKVPPRWMQRAGLQWLYRLFKEPRRLWRRYLYPNTLFVLLVVGRVARYAAIRALGLVTGKRHGG